MLYFVGKNGQRLGPFDAAQVREQLARGVLSPDDLVWRDGLAGWVPLRNEFPPASSSPPPIHPAPAASPSFRTEHATNPFLSAGPAQAQELAERDTRCLARLIDAGVALLVFTPGTLWFFAALATLEATAPGAEIDSSEFGSEAGAQLLTGLGGAFLLTSLLVLALVVAQTVLLSTRGQTIGKRAMKIRIVQTNGAEPDFVHAVLLRSVLMGLINAFAVVTALIDPLMIYREDRRCLHDLIAGTKVVKA